MDYKKFGNKIVLRLKKGDKIIESIEKLAKEENIKACHFAGIGAANEIKLAILNPGDDDYAWETYNEALEITSLVGNITSFEGEPMVHAHITCSREDFSVIGGHLGEGICSLTLELFVDLVDGELIKKHDDELKINTIEF